MSTDPRHALAEHVRQACIDAAIAGYEDAAIAGLCEEGAIEAAISAVRRLKIDDLLRDASAQADHTVPG